MGHGADVLIRLLGRGDVGGGGGGGGGIGRHGSLQLPLQLAPRQLVRAQRLGARGVELSSPRLVASLVWASSTGSGGTGSS